MQPMDVGDTTQAARRLRDTETRIIELERGLEAVRGVPTAASAIMAELEREQRTAAHLRADIEGADLPIDIDSLKQAMYSLRSDLSQIDSVPRPELRRRIREALPALYARHGRLVSSPSSTGSLTGKL
jgi:hypothetical protein